MLAEWVNELPDGEPVLVAGDFQRLAAKANHPLKVLAGLDEIFYPRPRTSGAHVSGAISSTTTGQDLRQNASASAIHVAAADMATPF